MDKDQDEGELEQEEEEIDHLTLEFINFVRTMNY